MWAISERLGVTLQALKDANPQVKPTEFRINPGDVLRIPGGKSPGTGPAPGGPTTSSGTYTVKSGDSMWAISERLGINLQALKDANPQVKPTEFRINPGDVLKISGGKPGGTGTGSGGGSRSYTVVSGDFLYSIATAHGVSLDALEAANPQVQPPQFLINVGQVITIP
jgi:LysM repeat protein